MTMLHTVNKSPYQKNSLDTCLRLAKEGSTILLIEDGVYAALKGSGMTSKVEEAMKKFTFCALGPDVEARGIQDKMIDGIKVVDYTDFVDLAAESSCVQSWL
jgi:tRNA 2-thiouridine synthesizing protein B